MLYCHLFIYYGTLAVMTASVTIDQTAMLACPGERVNINCSLEEPRRAIKWKLLCQCSAESCGVGTCSTLSVEVNSLDEFQHGNVCASAEPTPTYEHNFTTVRDMNDTLVSFGVLSIDVPLEFQQQNNTGICFVCNDQPSYGYLQVLGLPSSPGNFSSYPDYDYALTTDSEIVVNFMWSQPSSLPLEFSDDASVEYLFSISSSANTNNFTTGSTTLQATLEFNKIYSIAIYTVLYYCNGTLTSEPFMTNITINKDSLCLLPPALPGVNITIIAGSLFSFQCEEGLVSEERLLEAQCGPEGRWVLDPTLLMCMNASTEQVKKTTIDQACISPVLLAVISVSAVLMTLFLNVITFTLGVLVGVCRRKTRQQASTTVSAAQSEGASADMSETTTGVELERVHDYEDIVLAETKDMDTFTTNIAYGYAKQQ